MRARSLRLKLASWFVLVFFAIQAALLGAIVILRRDVIREANDEPLGTAVESMIDNVLINDVGWDAEQLDEQVPVGANFVFYMIRDEEGTLLASSGVDDREGVQLTEWDSVPAGPVVSVFRSIDPELAERITGAQVGRLRLVTVPFRRDERLYFLQAGVHDGIVDRVLGPYVDFVLRGIPVGLAAAIVAAWIIAGRAVDPMRQLSEAARDLSPTSLSERGERFEIDSSDREVARLESELNRALERLEAGYRAQDQFLTNVSHELRTPVAVLLTQAQVAKMGERTLEKGYAFVDKAEELLKRLGKVVESLLVLARADLTQRPPGDAVSVLDVVLGCMQTCKELARQNRVRLVPRVGAGDETGQDVVLAGEADLLQTMVENLVRNAISHSPADGEVTLAVDHTRTRLRIAVRDEGPGIPEDYRERIFDRFVQVPSDSARRDGSGLGLAIAHGVARLHGGSIQVENNEGAGCTFVVTLPLRIPRADETDA